MSINRRMAKSWVVNLPSKNCQFIFISKRWVYSGIKENSNLGQTSWDKTGGKSGEQRRGTKLQIQKPWLWIRVLSASSSDKRLLWILKLLALQKYSQDHNVVVSEKVIIRGGFLLLQGIGKRRQRAFSFPSRDGEAMDLMPDLDILGKLSAQMLSVSVPRNLYF